MTLPECARCGHAATVDQLTYSRWTKNHYCLDERACAKRRAHLRKAEKSARVAESPRQPLARQKEATMAKVQKVSARDAAIQVLRDADGPLKSSEIVTRVVATPGVTLKGDGKWMSSLFAFEHKKGKDGLFRKTAPGTYTLTAKGKKHGIEPEPTAPAAETAKADDTAKADADKEPVPA